MKDRKGFTLIELLVAITIIGIIMIMTLPAIHNLQRKNQEKKFDDYERTVLEAAKVYEDQYEEDLFGRSDTGCANIDFNSLVQKKLLATTKISGYECKNSNNGIIIRKLKGTSYYEVYLTCSKSGDTKNLTGNTGNYNEIKNNHCNTGVDIEPPSLTIKCDGDNHELGVEDDNFDGIYYYSATNTEGDKRIPKLTVEISDNIVGLEKNQYVTYEWKMYPNKILAEENPDYTEKNKTTFNIKDGDISTSKKNVRIIEQFKEKNKTGKAIVDIRGTNIVDRIGNKLDPQVGSKQCFYYYDNAKPKITITLTGASGKNYNIDGNEWINEKITTSVTVTDETENNIYSGIKTDTFKRNGGSEALSGQKPTHTYSRSDTNRKETDTFRVCDKVGNCDSDTVNIRVDTTPPVCGKTSTSAATPWINKNRTVTVGCSDNLSGCTQSSYSQTFGEGTTEIITIRDNAGNTTDCTVYTKVDKTKPVCTSSGGDPNWRNTGLTLTGTCTDNLSGCKQNTYTNDYPSQTSITDGFGGRACDVAGNCANCSKDQDVHIDMRDPRCTFVDIKNENTPNEPVIMTLRCRDDQALARCGHDEAGVGLWNENVKTEMKITVSASEDITRQVEDRAGNLGRCKIFLSASECTSNCCGTHNCNRHCGTYACYNSLGVMQYICSSQNSCACASSSSSYVACYQYVYDQCPDKCTSGQCCGYHVES